MAAPHRAAIGVADHNGWAMLATIAVQDWSPVLLDSRRVELMDDDLPHQPYHHETLSMAHEAGEALVAKVRAVAHRRASEALAAVSDSLPAGFAPTALAIRQPPLPNLADSLAEIHASWPTTCRADGMLYHVALCDAAERRGMRVVLHERGRENARAAAALGIDETVIETAIRRIGPATPGSWTKEYRIAAAVAIAALDID